VAVITQGKSMAETIRSEPRAGTTLASLDGKAWSAKPSTASKA
jgi:hypothetical protein